MRLTNEQLQKVKDKYGVAELYSWSKINTFMTSPYEFYLQYVLHTKPDRDNSAYAPIGGCVHQIIEDLYNNKIEYNDMESAFEDAWITAIDIADLRFVRGDEEKNRNIADKYKTSLQHFFANHRRIQRKIELERFLCAKIGDYVLQGYADAITKTDNDEFMIVDWKTSSMFTGKDLVEKSGQLVVYSIALMQLGVPLEKIKPCFCMLKYCNVEITQKNGNKKVRTIERYKLGESLSTNVRMWLKDYGCNEVEIDTYLKQLIDSNSIKCLPIDVQNKFFIDDCYVFVPLTQKLIDDWTDTIITTIKDIELRLNDYNQTQSINCFWDTEESVKAQSYYFSNLCSFSPNLHLPYQTYLKRIEAAQNGQDMFSGLLGSSVVSQSSNVINNKKDEIDLSWLDNIV